MYSFTDASSSMSFGTFFSSRSILLKLSQIRVAPVFTDTCSTASTVLMIVLCFSLSMSRIATRLTEKSPMFTGCDGMSSAVSRIALR